MDWTKVGAIGSATGGLFAALVFLATVWPWPQMKERKANQNGQVYANISKWISVPLVLSLAMSALAIWSVWNGNKYQYRPNAEYITVKGKTFVNEIVPLDGYDYIDCHFDNVTMLYNGTSFPNLSHNTFTGKFRLKSDNPTVILSAYTFRALGLLRDDVPLLDKDDKQIQGIEPPTSIENC